jgi:hypothetical protein
LDGNGELIDPNVMKIIARCMIRNKPDSYCQAHDVGTTGISELVRDLVGLYSYYGFHAAARPAQLARIRAVEPRSFFSVVRRIARQAWYAVLRFVRLSDR